MTTREKVSLFLYLIYLGSLTTMRLSQKDYIRNSIASNAYKTNKPIKTKKYKVKIG